MSRHVPPRGLPKMRPQTSRHRKYVHVLRQQVDVGLHRRARLVREVVPEGEISDTYDWDGKRPKSSSDRRMRSRRGRFRSRAVSVARPMGVRATISYASHRKWSFHLLSLGLKNGVERRVWGRKPLRDLTSSGYSREWKVAPWRDWCIRQYSQRSCACSRTWVSTSDHDVTAACDSADGGPPRGPRILSR